MSLHPDVAALLERAARSPLPPYYEVPPPVARRLYRESRAPLTPDPPAVESVQLRLAPGPGGPVPVRCYRPKGATKDERLPALLYFHGGGWVIGSLEAYDLPCRFFCARTGCAVVAVDYRLAPEHKFPAALDDAVASFRWLAQDAVELGIDPDRIVVAGDSAGGTLATVTAQKVRGEARTPCLQWLIYPATDLAADTPSHASCGQGFLLTQADMEWFRGLYLNDLSEITDPRVSPLRTSDLSGLPPALIFTAGLDPLRDEGRAYAEKLATAGVKVVHREFESLIHGFVGMRGALQAAARAMDDMVAGLRHELARLGR